LQQLRQQRSEQENTTEEEVMADIDVEVDPVGEQDIDPAVVFDGNAYSSNLNGAQPTSIGSWLNWWGYQKWMTSYSGTTVQQHPAALDNPQRPAATGQ